METVLNKATRLKNLNTTIQNFKKRVEANNIKLPQSVKIVEVGPRDGLQNEKTLLPAIDKIDFINRLSETGLKAIETTSFVSQEWVPQMGDNFEVFTNIQKRDGVSYPVLVPNPQGLELALKAGVKEIAIFGAASQKFTKKNINCSIDESFAQFQKVVDVAQKNNLLIRGYVSTVMGCPYEGDISADKVNYVAKKLYDMGCYEISLGDTIGIGNPEKTQNLFNRVTDVPRDQLAAHFHDTFDRAIPNILVALENGISVIDSSIGGLGGCPYANTKAGNVCTQNVAYVLSELGIETGIDLQKLQEIGEFITKTLKRENMSVL